MYFACKVHTLIYSLKSLVPWWSQTHVWNSYVTYFTISFIPSVLSIVIYAKWTFYIKFYSKIFSHCINVIESKCARIEVLYELDTEMFTPLSHKYVTVVKNKKKLNQSYLQLYYFKELSSCSIVLINPYYQWG